MLLRRICLFSILCVLQLACSKAPPSAARAAQPEPLPARAFHLHLPGIGGKLRMDRYMVEGLRESKLDADIEVYDWTRNDRGINALLAYERNHEEAGKVAEIIAARYREDPRRRISVTGHSGGAGLAVWALEQLPADVKVDSLVMLAPALSPEYDLSAALRQVRGKAYAFTSPFDVAVLGIGTRMFGTIDGVRTEAAGKVGFVRPKNGDEKEYAKLVELPFRSEWMRYGNIGDHLGPMTLLFAREVIGPLIKTGELPTTQPARKSTTQRAGATRE